MTTKDLVDRLHKLPRNWDESVEKVPVSPITRLRCYVSLGVLSSLQTSLAAMSDLMAKWIFLTVSAALTATIAGILAFLTYTSGAWQRSVGDGSTQQDTGQSNPETMQAATTGAAAGGAAGAVAALGTKVDSAVESSTIKEVTTAAAKAAEEATKAVVSVVPSAEKESS